LEIVQRKIFTPAPKLVTEVVGDALLVNVPLPDTMLHCPVPMDGVLAVKVAEFVQAV
jgi:hypothetical protein